MMTGPSREPVRLLVFSASLRAGSYNTRLARLAVRLLEENGGTVDAAQMTAFDCPSYNQDAQSTNGIAPGALELRRRLEANDAFVIASGAQRLDAGAAQERDRLDLASSASAV